MSDSKGSTKKTVAEGRALQRKQQKQEGRQRRADLLLEQAVKERGRHDQLESKHNGLVEELEALTRRVTGLEARVNNIEGSGT